MSTPARIFGSATPAKIRQAVERVAEDVGVTVCEAIAESATDE